MPIQFQQHITRADVRNNPDKIYLFGDNFARTGLGGQAKEMRGEPNTVGIATKDSPWTYLADGDYTRVLDSWANAFIELHDWLEEGKTIVIPSDGIGTGLSDLEAKAPRCYALLTFLLDQLYEAAEVAPSGGVPALDADQPAE